ncbi:MAG: 7-cyano-7-deazaguanine synthase [Terriglobales bacterium]
MSASGGAVVIASGGLDSSLCLALAHRSGGPVLALGFDYGQRNRIELERLEQIASRLACELLVVPLEMRRWVQGGLVGDTTNDGPSRNYVPARNLIFLAVAASVAEARGAERLYLGAGAADVHHPDCQPNFLEAFRAALSEGLHRPPVLRTPLSGLNKGQIILAAMNLGVPIELTWSCHHEGPRPCGDCAPCRLRRDTFSDLCLADPAL